MNSLFNKNYKETYKKQTHYGELLGLNWSKDEKIKSLNPINKTI
jgi:hypothetical protein